MKHRDYNILYIILLVSYIIVRFISMAEQKSDQYQLTIPDSLSLESIPKIPIDIAEKQYPVSDFETKLMYVFIHSP